MRVFFPVLIAVLPPPANTPEPPAPTPALEQEREASDLTFLPEGPRPGVVMEARYLPSPELAVEETLHLRARLRTPEGESYNEGVGSVTVAVLERVEDGTFRGSFQLPEDVVFAAFAMETVNADRVDGNEGLFWELLVRDDKERPTFEALEQRFNDHMGRNEPGVLESAREMVRLYPERPRAWTLLRAAEGWFLGDEGAEERETAHTERAQEFDRAFQERDDLTADEVAYLYWYSRGEMRDRWRERLLEGFPDHFFAAGERAAALHQENPDDPDAVQEGLESLWSEVTGKEARVRILRFGLSLARQYEDDARLVVWARRWWELDPVGGLSAALTLSSSEGGREEGISMLSEVVEKTEAAEDGDRALGATAAAQEEAARRRAAWLKRYLGDALIQAGRTAEGIGVLEEAAAEVWRPDLFRSLGEAYFNAGERDDALWHFAALAADPGTSEESADSLLQRAGVDASAWQEAVEVAREEMVRRTLASSESDFLPTVRLAAPDGATVVLQDLLGAEATVLVMWSRYCGYSNQAMPRIAALTKELGDQEVPFLALTRDPVDEARSFLQEEGFEVRALFDIWGEGGRALNSWGTPQYYVLDGAGRLRFSETTLDDIPRQVMALRSSDSER